MIEPTTIRWIYAAACQAAAVLAFVFSVALLGSLGLDGTRR
jgi:hypothetical protein